MQWIPYKVNVTPSDVTYFARDSLRLYVDESVISIFISLVISFLLHVVITILDPAAYD